MMHELTEFLENLTLVLGVAAVISFLFYKLRQPVVLGYILAGVIVGPYVPIPLAADKDIVHTLSELGVILLMFSLGLEFSIRKFIKVFPTAGLIALIQCSLMLWLGYVTGQMFGWTTLEAIYAGAIISISSTTIIVKAFSDEGIRDNLAEIVFAILIVEDLIAIMLMALLPSLSHSGGVPWWMLARTGGALFMFLITLVVIGLFLVPRVVRMVLRANKPEMTLVMSVGFCFALSLLAKEMSYSVALGAFIAGSLMAESGDEGYLHMQLQPLRDMFAAIFFVSVGMLIDPYQIQQNWLAIVVFTLLVLFGKFVSVAVGSFLIGNNTRLSIRSGLSLAQIGEFSFIIAGIGLATGGTREFLYPIAVAVSAITTLTTPWLIRRSEAVARWTDSHAPQALQTFTTLYQSWIHQLKKGQRTALYRSRVKRLLLRIFIDATLLAAVIIGSTLSMDMLTAHLMSWTSIKAEWAYGGTLVVAGLFCMPFCVGIIRCVRSLGYTLASEALPHADPGKADFAATPRRALVVTLQLMIILVVGLPLMAVTQPFLTSYYGGIVLVTILFLLGIVFWKSTVELQGHVTAGAEMVIEALNMSIDKQREIPVPQLESFLPGLGAVSSMRLSANSPAVGRTLSELNLRTLTGASVIAITRGDEGMVVPRGPTMLQEGDVVAVTGSEEAVQATRKILL